jgi:hypothetical protein
MKTTFVAAALALALAQPAAAITFPSLTTIYVGAGVTDDGGGENVGIATVLICTNVSGMTTGIRFLLLSSSGASLGASNFPSVAHGGTVTLGTHATSTFNESQLPTGPIAQGSVNIESRQSGVFCTAFIVDAADAVDMAPLDLVRVNPHPGTVE